MSDNRSASVKRITNETSISVELSLDGTGIYDVNTGIGFLDHMLDQLSRHSLIDLKVRAEGDLHIDAHHTIEDCGWAIGEAFSKALKDRKGITRYGSFSLPMDEALSQVALDCSNRPFLVWRATMPAQKLGDIDTELFREFFQAFSQAAGVTLHIENLYGVNTHHIVESIFKGVGRALRIAIEIDQRCVHAVPSTKGTLGGSV